MGLELVELVIRFEEAFGITISDEAAARMTTPREVTEFVATHVDVADGDACLSQQAFYFLRRGFCNSLQLPRTAFHSDVVLQTLIAKQNRKPLWGQLQIELGPRVLPDLARPLWLVYLLSAGTLSLAVFVSYATSTLPFRHKLALGLALLVLIGIIASVVTRPFKTEFRRRFRTFGGLVEHLLLHAPHVFKREQRMWTQAQIAETVRAIIVDITGKTDFTDDSHFINDMHLD
jgi:acyl carrier protein